MVTGIESFKEWFKGNESQYAIIGGTACDILMTEEGLDFRATKDIDLVLIIEAVDVAFGRKFWDYVKQAGYEHCNKSSGVPQFYRFSHPTSNRYPAMIELFTRKLDVFELGGKKWMICDCWKGLSAYVSDDFINWKRCPGNLLVEPGKDPSDQTNGHHADILVENGEAEIYYFTGQYPEAASTPLCPFTLSAS